MRTLLLVLLSQRQRLTVLLLGLALLAPSRAEDPGYSEMAILDLGSGRLLCRYFLDLELQRQIQAGSETPHYPRTRRFLGGQVRPRPDFDPDPGTKPVAPRDLADPLHSLGHLTDGTELVYREVGPEGEQTRVELGVLESGSMRVLARPLFNWAGRSLFTHDPMVAQAGPYLLVDEPAGVRCLRLADGSQAWRADWHLAHARWNWGAFFQQGMLFADVPQGLARVDPSTGTILWIFKQPAEFMTVRAYDDGRVYLAFIWPEENRASLLSQAFKKRHPGQPERTRALPHGTAWFGSTLFQGVWTLWEWRDDHWSPIFQHRAQDASDALYARYGFSPSMRRRLTGP